MVGDIARPPSKSPDCKCCWILNGWISDPHCSEFFVQYSDHVKSELLDHQTHVHDLNTGPVSPLFLNFPHLKDRLPKISSLLASNA